MKKITSFFFSFLILLITLGVVFYLGFASFRLKPGECAVLVSKTSGVSKEPVEFGKFYWAWQMVLPTNATLNKFDISYKTISHTESGVLPQAELYKVQGKDSPDFSYKFDIKVTLCPKAQFFLSQTKLDPTFSEAKATQMLQNTVSLISKDVANLLLSSELSTYTSDDLLVKCNISTKYLDMNVSDILVDIKKIPDIKLYNKIRDTYLLYQEKLDAELLSQATMEAANLANDNRAMAKLSKLGELLSLYPQLADLCKNGDVTNILKMLETLR